MYQTQNSKPRVQQVLLTRVSRYSEFPPSMMMSPWSNRGAILSMKSSTADPALTSIMTRRGFFSLDTMSSSDLAPTMLVPVRERGSLKHGGNVCV